jgi:hypothetical protein
MAARDVKFLCKEREREPRVLGGRRSTVEEHESIRDDSCRLCDLLLRAAPSAS